jgi:glycosyltransferase involved in cell wall biosynthesis
MNPKIFHINLAKGFRGGERQTLLLIKELVGKVDQTVVIRKGAGLSKVLDRIRNIEVIEIKKPFLMNIKKLKHASLVHAHEAKGAHLAFWGQCFFGTPYVITRRVVKSPKNRVFFKKVHMSADRVVAISNQVATAVKTVDPKISCQVIHSSFSSLPVDFEEVKRLRHKYRGKYLIGHVGALVNKDKGQVHIINVAKQLSRMHPEIHFLLLGEGKDKERFMFQAKGCPNIEFTGFKDNIGDYYAIFDLFIFPSLDEGLGSSILDAFFFSVPVIASDVGGIPDLVINHKTGILIPPGDEQALHDNIIRLYSNTYFAKCLGQNGRDSLTPFDIRHTACQYLGLYHDIQSNQRQ